MDRGAQECLRRSRSRCLKIAVTPEVENLQDSKQVMLNIVDPYEVVINSRANASQNLVAIAAVKHVDFIFECELHDITQAAKNCASVILLASQVALVPRQLISVDKSFEVDSVG